MAVFTPTMVEPGFSAPQENKLDDAVFGDEVHMLYSTSGIGPAASVVFAVAIASLAPPSVDPALALGWLAALLAAVLARLLLRGAFAGIDPGPARARRWYGAFFAGTILHAALWGAAGVIFYVSGDGAAQAALLLILAGAAAGGVPTLAARQEIYFGSCAAMLVPIGVVAAAHGGHEIVLAALAAALLAALLVLGTRCHTMLESTLRAGFDAEMRAQRVAAGRDRTAAAHGPTGLSRERRPGPPRLFEL